MDIQLMINKLRDLNIPQKSMSNILGKYDETHRYYHNINHVLDLLEKAEKRNILDNNLFLAIVYHDLIYDVERGDNEEKSAEMFENDCKYLNYEGIDINLIKSAILDTKEHKVNGDNIVSKYLIELDLSVLHGSMEEFIKFEDKIFKEYQYCPYNIYKDARISILKNLGVSDDKLNYVKYKKPKIAIYPGSFNPFHKGHFDILTKAEQIFDKVILFRGINPTKDNSIVEDFPIKVKNRQLVNYKGLLTDYISSLPYDVTIVRGLRNSKDFEYELTQYRYLKDLKHNVKTISIFCDPQFEHVSSSWIKQLESFDINKGKKYRL